MKVLMVGVDKSTKGGMWTVVENYLNHTQFVRKNNMTYIPTCITGCSVPDKLLFTLKAYIKIMRLYKIGKIDILHVHMSERASIRRKRIIMDYAKKRGSKIVLHMHGAEFEVLYKRMSEKKKHFVRETLNLADKIIILGNYWKKFIGELVDDTKKIQVVYNAVEVPEINYYEKSNKTFLFLGAVSKRKGIDILIRALKEEGEYLKDKIDVKIFGPDVEHNIEYLIKDNKLEDWVQYCGWLNQEDKPNILKKTAVNILPSYNEGLPMTILEAMSYGIPSITTTVAAIPEAVNSNNGILISPGDVQQLSEAIKKMARDEDYRNFLSKNAYEDAKKKFSIATHINAIQLIYEEIIK